MSLIVHPEVKKLKEELSQLIFEYDNLYGHVCPVIERKYILEFGICEYKLYELELKIDKLKRKIQLIQIEINNGNEIDLNRIDEKINEEFEEYEKQIQVQLDEINYLENNIFDKLSADDAKKLKKLYRILVKKLHPDLNPNQTFFELNLFFRAVKCFEDGNLKGLESVAALLPDEQLEEVSEIDKLEELIREYKDKISDLKNDYPYNKKDLLENRRLGMEYKEMLIGLIKDRKEDIETLENKISELIKNV